MTKWRQHDYNNAPSSTWRRQSDVQETKCQDEATIVSRVLDASLTRQRIHDEKQQGWVEGLTHGLPSHQKHLVNLALCLPCVLALSSISLKTDSLKILVDHIKISGDGEKISAKPNNLLTKACRYAKATRVSYFTFAAVIDRKQRTGVEFTNQS